MKTPFKQLLIAGLCLAAVAHAMDDKGYASIYESIAAFEDRPADKPGYEARIFNRPGYVKPIITNLSPVLNSNWYVSATVPQSISFEAGLPFAIIPIGSDDRSFSENGASVPTIFGDHGDPQNYDPTVYGNETLHNLGVFTYPYLQLAGGYYHARLVLRGMWLPAVSELQKFNLIGIGLQYSFGHLFQYMLPKPAQSLDVSLVLGYSSSGISYQPEDYEGTLDLDISAFTFDFVIGYKPIEMVEVMLTLGYQSGSMASSGHLVSHAEGWNEAFIDPNSLPDRFVLPPGGGLRLRRQVQLHHQRALLQAAVRQGQDSRRNRQGKGLRAWRQRLGRRRRGGGDSQNLKKEEVQEEKESCRRGTRRGRCRR